VRAPAHVFFGLGLLPWLVLLPLVFMQFGQPGLDTRLVGLASLSYLAYPALYVASLILSAIAALGTPESRWATRWAFLPALSPVLFAVFHVAVATGRWV